MEKRNTSRRTVVTGVLTLLLCVAALFGVAYAWFTDSVSSDTNIIQAGNLKITATVHTAVPMDDETFWDCDYILGSTLLGNDDDMFGFYETGDTVKDFNGNGDLMSDAAFEPGKTYVKMINIKNLGSLAAKVKLSVIVQDGGLQDALWYALDVGSENVITRAPMSSLSAGLDGASVQVPAGSDAQLLLAYGMNEDAGNEYQGKTFTATFSLLATQAAVEEDGFGPDYDVDAAWPETALPNRIETTLTGTAGATEATVLKDEAKGVQATIPAGAVAEDTTVKLTVSTTEVTETSATYEISLTDGSDAAVPLSDKVEVTLNIGKHLTDVAVRHNGNAMDPADYAYDKTTGILTIRTAGFSPFEITYTPDYAARIGNLAYESLQQALDAAKEGDTIVLGKDLNIDKTVVVDKTVTLDLNGKTVSNTNDVWNEAVYDWSLVSVRGGALTVTGDGALQAKENDSYALDITDGGRCVIESGTFVGNIHSVYVLEGALTVNGGTFSVQQKFSAQRPDEYVLNCYDAHYKAGTAVITVNGGSFVNFNPADCYAEGAGTSFVSAGRMVVADTQDSGDTLYTVCAVADNGDGTFTDSENGQTYVLAGGGTLVRVTPYPQVDGLYLDAAGNAYAGTTEAMMAVIVSSRETPYGNVTLTLLQDVTIAPASAYTGYLFLSDAVFDLNGKTLTVGTNDTFMLVGNNVTVRNGAIRAGSANISYPVAATANSQNIVFEDMTVYGGIEVLGNSTVTLKNVTSQATQYYNVYLAGGKATVTVESGTFTAKDGLVHFYTDSRDGANCQVTVNGGTFSGGAPTHTGAGTLTNNLLQE